jgi:ABC-type uncharacterized transport system ATPase subunit
MIRELFRTLETTLHERLSLIEQILVAVEKPKVPLYDNEFVKRIERLERQVPQMQMPDTSYLESRISALEEQLAATHAEVEELRLARVVVKEPSVILPDEDVEGEVLEDEPEEEAALELEPLEYRGVTYYKDADNNVYGTDEEGAVIPEPIARWNGTKLVRLTS